MTSLMISPGCLKKIWKHFLFSKHNFEIIWFYGPFWHFCSPECIQITIRRILLQRNDQYFKWKISPWIKICDNYGSIIWMTKIFSFRSPSSARDARDFHQTPWLSEHWLRWRFGPSIEIHVHHKFFNSRGLLSRGSMRPLSKISQGPQWFSGAQGPKLWAPNSPESCHIAT